MYFDVVEALSQADSAAGWSVLISTSTMTMTTRGLPDATLAAMFTSPREAIMAGSGPPKGRAIPAPGGYRLTGRWTQGSNILLARWIHVGCHLYDGDRPRLGADGQPDLPAVRAARVPDPVRRHVAHHRDAGHGQPRLHDHRRVHP